MLRSVAGPFPTKAHLGTAIREVRERKGITIEALAEIADVHPTYLSGIERRRRNPSWEKLRPLAEVLDVDMSELAKRAEAIAAAEQRQTTDPSAPDS